MCEIFGSFVLAGAGGTLKVLSLESSTCVREVEAFEGHNIYGIQADTGNNILLFGSKSVKIYRFSLAQNGVCLSCIASICLEDWVLAAHWFSDGTKIALVTAHNDTWLWEWLDRSSALQQSVCSEKCILYSASISGDNWTKCVVFSGTVFSEVIVWLPGEQGQPIIHRLKGHNGVIFSMTWDGSSLCSTSDDRTIRLWSFSFPNKHDWKSSTVACSQIFYGHSARVWRSIIFQDFIVSVGEDCHICVWSMKGTLLQILERTLSGCQWSLDYNREHKLLVVGAGDGSVQLIPLVFPLSSPAAHEVSYPTTITSLLNSSRIRKLILLKTDCIVVVTEEGMLLSGYPGVPDSWRVVCLDDRFRNYCLLTVCPSREKFSLASLHGLVCVFEGDAPGGLVKTFEKQVENGKIWSLLWLSSKEIVVCGDEGRLTVWQICQNEELNLVCIGHFKLPRARERWPTCAILCQRYFHHFLMCGDRSGSVHLFQVGISSNDEYSAPVHSLPKLHGKLGVTSLLESGCQIFSTGRDGTVRILGVSQNYKQLSVLSSDKLIMEWVCTILPMVTKSKHFLIVGFKEYLRKRTILNFDCGGGHRSWDCIISGERKLSIAYIREKNTFYSSWNLDALMKPTLLCGLSPRELNCAVLVPDLPSSILFGGEDGTIYLCKFSPELSDLESKLTLSSHISSVRCICLNNDLFFSAGGRAQLKAWRIEKDGMVEVSCIELSSFMLKGEQHPKSPPSVDPEMRFMTLSCLSGSKSKNVVQIVAGCSDGALRWLTFDLDHRSFQIVGESMFHSKCVLKVLPVTLQHHEVVLISTATDGNVAFWHCSEMFTDVKLERRPFWSDRFHQSGVNCIHAQACSLKDEVLLLLASGGDDNSVLMSALRIRNKDVTVVDKWSSSSAHAAQVTGVWLIGNWLLSTSIDQRLTLWKWMFRSDTGQLKCDFVHQSLCSVPDIQDMQLWQEKSLIHVCVVGKGAQIVSIQV